MMDDALGDATDEDAPDRPEAAAAHYEETGPEILAEVQDGIDRPAGRR